MGEIGCYVLDLYCDHPSPTCPEVGRAQFTGIGLSDARADALKVGWQMRANLPLMDASGHPLWVCPACAPLNSAVDTSGETEPRLGKDNG